MTQAFIVGLLLVGLICLGSFVCPRGVVHALGCSPLLEENAVNYLLWLLPGLFFLFVECVGMMLIRLDGAPKYAMTIQIVAAVVNIVLDWYMVFPLGWGVIGAALATSIACAVGGTMVFAYFFRFADKLRFYPLKRTVTSLLLTLRNTGYMVRIGFATFLTELAMSVMMLTGNYMFISMLGEEGVAAFAIACYLFPVVFSISNAVAQSAQPIISFNYGAHLLHRVSRALRISVQSVEKAMASTVYTLLRGILFLVPCFVLLPRAFGVPGLWLAIPAAELLTCAVIYITYIRHKIIGTRIS